MSTESQSQHDQGHESRQTLPVINEPQEATAEPTSAPAPTAPKTRSEQTPRHPSSAPTGDSGLSWATAATLNVIEDGVTAVRTSISSWTNHLTFNANGEPIGDPERGIKMGTAPSPAGLDDNAMPPAPIFTPITRPLTLATLPIELQLHIIRQMPFGDIQRLRKTCRHFYALGSRDMLQVTLGKSALDQQLLAHCSKCLLYDPDRINLLRAEPGDAWPFTAKCIGCALHTRDWRLSRRTMGFKVTMADATECWVCRWCSEPVISGQAQGHAQFHRLCWQKYNLHLVLFFLAGLGQFCAGVVASALAWRYWRGDRMVWGPATANFILMWFVLFMLLLRGNQFRTYGVLFLFELTMLCLWIPPIYAIAKAWDATPAEDVEHSTRATAIFIAFNMISRLLNVLGNIILWAEYDFSKHSFKGTPWWQRKLLNRVMFMLIFWTYPQSLEQRYREPPPSILFLKRKLLRKMGDRK